MSFFQAQAIGNLGRDPEMSYTPDGTAVTRFSIATTKKMKGKDDVTTWINCVAFRQPAETLHTFLHKGDQVFVQGPLEVRQYTTKDGRNGVSLDLVVDKFSFVGGKKSNGAATSENAVADTEPWGDGDLPAF